MKSFRNAMKTMILFYCLILSVLTLGCKSGRRIAVFTEKISKEDDIITVRSKYLRLYNVVYTIDSPTTICIEGNDVPTKLHIVSETAPFSLQVNGTNFFYRPMREEPRTRRHYKFNNMDFEYIEGGVEETLSFVDVKVYSKRMYFGSDIYGNWVCLKRPAETLRILLDPQAPVTLYIFANWYEW